MIRYFWRLFNALARLCGLAFAAGGITLIVATVLSRSDTSLGRTEETITYLAGATVSLLGLAMLRVRAFRPDLGDIEPLLDPFGARGNSQIPRTWWTGDPKTRKSATA